MVLFPSCPPDSSSRTLHWAYMVRLDSVESKQDAAPQSGYSANERDWFSEVQKWLNALHSCTTNRTVSVLFTGITFLSGAFVAGNDAGRAYNDWPMYAGEWIPNGMTCAQ